MIGVLGSGSWATAIVKILLEDPNRIINWWVREPDIIEGLLSERHNPLYLREAFIDTERIHISSNITEVIVESDDIFVVVPSAFVDAAFQAVPVELTTQKNFISATKGMVASTNQLVTEYLKTKYQLADRQLAIISGPTHAEETAQENLSYLTVASTSEALASRVRLMLHCPYIKTQYSNDIIGIQYSTVLKNIYAVAVGMAHGLGRGDNLIAVLITRCAYEAHQALQHLAPVDNRQSFQPAYLGDLLVTCYSQHSRNRSFGNMIGRGYSVEAAKLEMNMIAEGYYAVACMEKIRVQRGCDMPIMQTVYDILYKQANCRRMMNHLLENLF